MSVYNYIVAKHFEIAATGSLLMAEENVSPFLRELGFHKDVHYIAVSKRNLESRIRFVLNKENHARLDEIRRRGQSLVLEKHKTSDRASLIDRICRLR